MAAAGLAAWRASAPELVAEVAEEWGLRIGEAYPPGVCGRVVRAQLPEGTPAALKIFWPHRESDQEADALERWDGEAAVRLLARDDDRNALLLERCEPGHFLSAGSDDPVGVLINLLPRPLAGEREFSVAPIVRSFELGHSRRDALYRLDRLTSELGLDRERARGWTISQTIAWSGGSDHITTHMETVEWLL
jgi:hypothetical protein